MENIITNKCVILRSSASYLMVVGDLRYLPLVDEDERPSGIIGSRDLIDHFGSLAMS